MDSTFAFKPKVTTAVLVASIACAVLSFFTLNSMNINVVHSKLYSYGLTFSSQWADQYWQYLTFAFITIVVSLVFAALALSSLAFAVKRGSNRAQKCCSTFSVTTILSSVSSVVLFVLINSIVNGELYSFGLRYSAGWFSIYQIYFAGFIILQATVMILSASSFSMVSFGSKPFKISPQKTIFSTLLVAGSALIGFSLIYNYMIAFFGGFALVFWGSIMVFISAEHLVKKDVLDATSLTYLAHLNKAANQTDMQNMVYASQNELNKIQKPSNPLIPQIQHVEMTIGKPERVNLAPENELFNLLERTYGKSFSRIGFSELKTVLPKLLVEALELAQNVTIDANGETVKVTVENPYDLQVYLKANNQNRLIDAVGCPLAGAIAYALANSSGKPVIISQLSISQDKKTVHFEYTLLGQRSESA
ncbi:MAG: hypothetical protein ACQCN5_07680 [Candidatus Bathyarchaeia archaeon]|jgi:hypothetical protein